MRFELDAICILCPSSVDPSSLSRLAHCATDYSAAGISSTLNGSKGFAAFGDTLFRHGAKRQNDGGKGGEWYQKPKTHP
jgi:hypothetical protein